MPELSKAQSTLTWSLIVPTYRRRHVLLSCLRFAAQQTLSPKEIVVVDASPDWDKTHQIIMAELAAKHSHINWIHAKARRISSAAQRNQAIELSSGDILFLIDDDSFMYPTCAAEVLHIYACDTGQEVAGIMPVLEAAPPQEPHKRMRGLRVFKAKLYEFAKWSIRDDDIFIPYQFKFPQYTLPEHLRHLPVHPVPMIHGARMTFRRYIFNTVQFEETLERYAVNEDNDVCYRASLQGMLLQAYNAQICHLEAPQGRLSRFTTTALWGLNQALLHRLHSPDLKHFRKLFTRLLWRRIFTQMIKDFVEFRWSMPSVRGVWYALQHYQDILARSPAELRAWYPEFQRQLINRDSTLIKNTKKKQSPLS